MSYSLINFDIQGHRGCRGVLPENSIPGFIRAVQMGVTSLEMDVVITGDFQVLVSHDPYMEHTICLTPSGDLIKKADEKTHNIFQLDLHTVQKYDCGSIGIPLFKEQTKMSVHKPLLSEAIDAVEKFIKERKLKPIRYNIEIKCTTEGEGIFHPSPEIFSDLVMKVVREKSILKRTTIMSFDSRILQYLKRGKDHVNLSLLIENVKTCIANIELLGFTPDFYNPHYKLVTIDDIKLIHKMGAKIIPWTVNEVDDYINLIGMGVDGIITDYPERLVKLVNN